MITFNSTTPEPVSALTLLDIISDPSSAKKHLQDILDAQGALIKSKDEHTAAQQAAEASSAKSEEAANKHTKALEDFNTVIPLKEQEFSRREAALTSREDSLSAKAQEFQIYESNKSTDLTQRENNVSAREKAVSDMETSMRQLQDKAQTMKEFYEVKVANLRDALRTDYTLKADTGYIGTNI